MPINSKINYLTNTREIALVAVKEENPTFNSSYDKGIYTYPLFLFNMDNKGKRWTKEEEDDDLIYEVNNLIPLEKIAENHKRGLNGIKLRIIQRRL